MLYDVFDLSFKKGSSTESLCGSFVSHCILKQCLLFLAVDHKTFGLAGYKLIFHSQSFPPELPSHHDLCPNSNPEEPVMKRLLNSFL
jgi:hypothetical protein